MINNQILKKTIQSTLPLSFEFTWKLVKHKENSSKGKRKGHSLSVPTKRRAGL